MSERNRADLRYIDGEFSWRYRNRLSAERTFSLRSFHFAPYLRAEVFYDSRFEKWPRTALTAGSTFPIGKHFDLEWYYEHQNDTPILRIDRLTAWDTSSRCIFDSGASGGGYTFWRLEAPTEAESNSG